ncbi:MAG: hypothetical protein LUM44_17630 [Pyrinomonadaceae bacterium]|nr:hypothetical protein [Pyrinomonadaceae bacterium]
MAFLTEEEFRVLYVTNSESELSPAQYNQCLEEGIDLIAKLCGETLVTEIEDAGDDSSRKNKAVRRAQGKLAYRALLTIQTGRYRAGGVISQEKDQNDSVTNQYEKASETEKRREWFYQSALEDLSPYLIQNADGDSFDNPIEFSHPVINAEICC